MTDLNFWDSKLYSNLYQVTFDILNNDVSHVFTEILLNVMFQNFISLDASWNCSGYGNKKLYPLLKLRDRNLNPKIIHWSGCLKPWHNKGLNQWKIRQNQGAVTERQTNRIRSGQWCYWHAHQKWLRDYSAILYIGYDDMMS